MKITSVALAAWAESEAKRLEEQQVRYGTAAFAAALLVAVQWEPVAAEARADALVARRQAIAACPAY